MVPGPVILDLEGLVISAVERRRLLNPYVGGVILFSRNIANYEQLQDLVADIRRVRPDLLVSVDQEGGRVQRCREGFTRLPPMQVFDGLYDDDRDEALALARDCGWLMACEVRATDIDFSFAPVLDVDDRFCSVIGDRSFSSDADRVTALSSAFIDGMHDAGMAVTGKHFPGHGSVTGDSHLELPVDGRALIELEAKDLQPFNRLLAKLDALMPAHIVFPAVDAEHAVGFSKLWLQGYLREQAGYRGVIFSDCLTMAGAAAAGNYSERAEAALKAGCDVILVCNNPAGAEQVLKYLAEIEYPRASSRFVQMVPKGEAMDRLALQQQPRWQRIHKWLSGLDEAVAVDPTENYLKSVME